MKAQELPAKFKKGDKVIWDSHFGYEIGIFEKVSDSQYHSYVVDTRTGKVVDFNTYPIHEIHPYSDELISHLTKKYGYEKRFATDF